METESLKLAKDNLQNVIRKNATTMNRNRYQVILRGHPFSENLITRNILQYEMLIGITTFRRYVFMKIYIISLNWLAENKNCNGNLQWIERFLFCFVLFSVMLTNPNPAHIKTIVPSILIVPENVIKTVNTFLNNVANRPCFSVILQTTNRITMKTLSWSLMEVTNVWGHTCIT